MKDRSKKELLNYVVYCIVKLLNFKSKNAQSYILARLKNKKSRQLIYSALRHVQKCSYKTQFHNIDNLLSILHCIYGDVL